MKLPKQISPDCIKDAITEIKYSSKLPFDILLGLFFNALDGSYEYVNRPFDNPKLPIELANRVRLSLNAYIFYNEHIKFELLPEAIVFNCFDKYIGWDLYIKEIEKVIQLVASTGKIDIYERIGIRYISEYPNLNLSKITKFYFNFGMPEVQSNRFNFRSEFNDNNLTIVLNLAHNVPVITNNKDDQKNVSIIDIDVISQFSVDQTEELIQKLQESHLKEKEVFFSLLNEDFLNTLNPVY